MLWEFTIRPEHREAFERAYSAQGDWAQLFRRARGYLSTDLLRDAERPDVYVTIDRWQQPEDYVAGMASLAPSYQDLDRRCEAYTLNEHRIGNFVQG